MNFPSSTFPQHFAKTAAASLIWITRVHPDGRLAIQSVFAQFRTENRFPLFLELL